MKKAKKVKQDEKGRWYIEDFLWPITFPQRPPDWIIPHLEQILNLGKFAGERKIKNQIKKLMSLIND